MQHRHGQNKRTIKPVGHIDMADFAFDDGAKKDDGVGHPHQGNQDVNRPFQLSVFFAAGVTQGQADGRCQDHRLPTPKRERR